MRFKSNSRFSLNHRNGFMRLDVAGKFDRRLMLYSWLRSIATSVLLAATFSIPIIAAGVTQFKLPPPDSIKLHNGLVVYFHQEPGLPLVSFRILLGGAGVAYEPAKIEGVADLTAQLLLRGTATMSAEQVAEEIDFMGASLDSSAGDEYAVMEGQCLSEYFPRLWKIAAQSLTAPTLAEQEFEKERKRRVEMVKAIKDEPQEAVRAYFRKAYFGDHPLSNLEGGTEESLTRLKLGELKEFHSTRYRPDRTIVVVVGDITKDQLTTLLTDTLSQWPRPQTSAPALGLPPLPVRRGRTLLLVDKPDATQSYFVLGAPGYPMGDPVSPTAEVVNTLFGGRFTSWLNTELRIKRGLTYGAHSSFIEYRNGGVFNISSYTKNPQISEMLDITLGLLKKARTEGFTAKEVESARNYILGQFPPTLESFMGKTDAYMKMAFYGLGFDYFDKLLGGVSSTTAPSCQESAARLFPFDDYTLVVVGKAEEVRSILAKYGQFREKKISEPGF